MSKKLDQALSLAKVIGKSIAGGKLYAEPEEIMRRRAICVACPFNVMELCQKCGCKIANKTAAHGATCPDEPSRW